MKWVEVPYVLVFISLKDMSDLQPKGADLGVKPSAASCSLTLPLYLGLPTEQAENQGTLLGGVASVSVDYLEDQKVHRSFTGLTLLYDFTWRDVIRFLGQTLTPDLRARVLGEATTFGGEWLDMR